MRPRPADSHGRPRATRQSALRLSDIARRTGSSVYLLQMLLRDGVLPPVLGGARNAYVYDDRHLRFVQAYLLLSHAVGPHAARAICRGFAQPRRPCAAQSAGWATRALEGEVLLIDRVLEHLKSVDTNPSEPTVTGWQNQKAAAALLGLAETTLRRWVSLGLLHPRRNRVTDQVLFSVADLHRARVVMQLDKRGIAAGKLAAVLAYGPADDPDLTSSAKFVRSALYGRLEDYRRAMESLHQISQLLR